MGAAQGGTLQVTVTYQGSGEVGPNNAVWLAVWDTPTIPPDGSVQPIAGSPVAENGDTASFAGLSAATVYLTAIYDAQGGWMGTTAVPSGSPAGVEGLEPDTRGTTTIREQLDAHRSNPVCASCHRVIDPPGFALESFDPIGGFRTRYRATGGELTFGDFTVPAPYTDGLPVDSSGITPSGDTFADIQEYKRLMLRNDLEQVARNLTAQFLVYSTGAEIEFADRDAVEGILARLRDDGYPIRTMLHEVVRSDLFRSR